MSAPLYRVTGVEHSFAGRLALVCGSFEVEPGSIVGICGTNGAGKSTLLSVMAFLLAPDKGTVLFDGEPGRCGDVDLRRRAVLLPQDPGLLKRTVSENVLYGLKVRGAACGDAAERALELVGLNPGRYLKRWWRELSGGEARRVALAARLALSPQALLLDEPTASLDPESAEKVRLAVRAARDATGLTVVAVSHDREWLDSACDRMYRLRPCRGLSPQPPQEVPCAL